MNHRTVEFGGVCLMESRISIDNKYLYSVAVQDTSLTDFGRYQTEIYTKIDVL